MYELALHAQHCAQAIDWVGISCGAVVTMEKNTIEKRLKLKSKQLKSICHVVCRHIPSWCVCVRSWVIGWVNSWTHTHSHTHTYSIGYIHAGFIVIQPRLVGFICLRSGACIHHHWSSSWWIEAERFLNQLQKYWMKFRKFWRARALRKIKWSVCVCSLMSLRLWN